MTDMQVQAGSIVLLPDGRIDWYAGDRQDYVPFQGHERIGYTITYLGWSRDSKHTGERWEHNIWVAKYRHQGRQLQVTYRTGMAIDKPTPWGPLAAAFSDARDLWEAESLSVDYEVADKADFRSWCDDYGMDPDDVPARRTFNACVRQARRLLAFMPDDERRPKWAEALDLKESGE